MKSLFSLAAFAAAGLLIATPLSAQELLLNYNFDESSTGKDPTIDHGSALPRVDGRFFLNATRTGNTPGNASLGALDVTQGGHILANYSNPNVDSLDGKLDNLTQTTVTVWINLQADPQQYDRIFSTGLNGIGLQILPPVTIDGVDPGPMSASSFSIGLDTTDGTGPSYRNFDADNKWVFIAVTFDGTLFQDPMKFYTGDVETESTLINSTTPNIWEATSTLNAHLFVGNHSSSTSDRQFDGYIDDLRIYRGVLTPEQVEEVRLENLVPAEPPAERGLIVRYNFDESTSGDDPTLDLGTVQPLVDGRFLGGATRTANTPAGASVGALDVTAPEAWVIANEEDLDGKLDSLTAFTTTLWVNLQADPRALDRIFRAGGTTGFGYRITDPSSGTLSASNFGLALDLANGAVVSSVNIDANNKWVFIAATFDAAQIGQQVQFIVGGESAPVELKQVAPSANISNTGVLTELLVLGRHPTATTRIMNGYLDDFRVYGEVLSLEEIEAIRLENLGGGTPDSGFASWVTENFDAGEQADPSLSGADADPDGDGIANLLEYALGGLPKISSRDVLPEVNVDPNSGYLTLSFVRPNSVTGIDYVVESSIALDQWAADAVLIDSTPVTGGVQEVYRTPAPISANARAFLRLRVVQN